jgi:hypothetical protein
MNDESIRTPLKERVETVLREQAEAVPLPALVYHYTSLKALIPIVQTGKIWCSNVKYSNDPAEIIYGDSVLREMLENRFPDFLLGGLSDTIANIDYYAAAFSAQPDGLLQWRAYCQNGQGVAIAFDSQALASHAGMLFRRVEYDREAQIDFAAKVMAVYADEIRKARGDKAALRIFLEELALAFVILRGVFKERAYAGEVEYRFFNTLPSGREPRDTPLLCRATETTIIPYFEVDLARNRVTCGSLPVREVVIGPCLDPDLAKASIRVLLDQADLSSVDIVPSQVRMRAE